MNPAELGYYEKRPGSGTWYHLDKDKAAYVPRVCVNAACGAEFMAASKKGRGLYCSRACANACLGERRRTSTPSYKGRHKRVYRARGPARDQACVDCGKPAREWSQIHGTDGTDEFEHYMPRCRSCHDSYDTESERRGEDRPNAGLTNAQVRDIYLNVGTTPKELGEIYGVDPATVRRIRRGERWQHITKGADDDDRD